LCKWYLWPLFFKSAGFPQPGNLRLNIIYGTTIRGDLVWEVSDGHYSSLPSTRTNSTTWVLLNTRWQCFPQSLLILSDVLALKFEEARLWKLLFTLHIVNSCRTACTTVTTTMLTASLTCACTIVNKCNEWLLGLYHGFFGQYISQVNYTIISGTLYPIIWWKCVNVQCELGVLSANTATTSDSISNHSLLVNGWSSDLLKKWFVILHTCFVQSTHCNSFL